MVLGDRSASSVGDGIPDHWRLRYFGSVSSVLSQADADADGDGVSNLQEFKAGTNPVDLRSKLALLAELRNPDAARPVALKWPSIAGKHYVVERAGALASDRWSVLAPDLVGTGATLEYGDGGSVAGTQFYRVRVIE